MISLKLREIKNNLSAKELQVSEYILQHIEELKSISIQALAELNDVSTTTILRLCNKLGYKGFSDFKIDLISSSISKLDNNKFLQDDINLHDGLWDVNRKVQAIEKSSIDETYAIANTDSLEKAIQLIIDSNKIIIYGASSSGLVGKELEYQLIKIKKDVSCHFDFHVQRNIANSLDHNDLIIVISHSGETNECIELLKIGKNANVPSIAITKMGHSRVSALSTVVLHTTSTENVSRLIPIRSKMSQISVIDMLVTNLFIKKYDYRLSLRIRDREELKYTRK